MSKAPLFEMVSNPTVKMEDARAYHRGEITAQELADRSIDTVTGKPLSVDAAVLLAAFGAHVVDKKGTSR